MTHPAGPSRTLADVRTRLRSVPHPARCRRPRPRLGVLPSRTDPTPGPGRVVGTAIARPAGVRSSLNDPASAPPAPLTASARPIPGRSRRPIEHLALSLPVLSFPGERPTRVSSVLRPWDGAHRSSSDTTPTAHHRPSPHVGVRSAVRADGAVHDGDGGHTAEGRGGDLDHAPGRGSHGIEDIGAVLERS